MLGVFVGHTNYSTYSLSDVVMCVLDLKRTNRIVNKFNSVLTPFFYLFIHGQF